jgi:DNA polymerase IV
VLGEETPHPTGTFQGDRPVTRPNAGTPRRILLVDCDMFFVQVARLEDPEGAGRAPLLVVGGSPTGRGVVTSADYRVRGFGVRSGMPMARALRLCPDATVAPVPREACVSRSRTIRSTLEEIAPRVQAASIDEFYLDLTGTERLYRGRSLSDLSHHIRERVLERTGISVSVGGGTVRLVAKLAVERGKPGGVHLVPPGSEGAFLREHALADIPGVGPSLVRKLERRGFRTVAQLLPVEEGVLRGWFGEARGRWLWERIRGIDPSIVDPDQDRKSVSSERTFATDVEADRHLARELHRLSLEVGRVLRRKGLRARTVTVKLRDSDFTTRQASRTLSQPLESDRAIFRTASDLLEELRVRRSAPARLLGVGVSSLTGEEAPRQLALLDRGQGEETDRDRILSRAADRIRDRFGRSALLPGQVLEREKEEKTSSPHSRHDRAGDGPASSDSTPNPRAEEPDR